MQSNRLLELHQEGKPDTASMFEYFKFLSYCKNYEGRLVRGDKNEENYRFYNEREWRIVALSEEINNQLTFMYGDLYFKNKQKINEKIQDCYVKFSHLDISYLIVDNEAEIPELLNAINHIYEDYATAKELKILSSKILTKTQICNDF